MIKKLALLGLFFVFILSTRADAAITFFDFEGVGSASNLGSYMTNLLGRTVDPTDAKWENALGTHASTTFKSASIFAYGDKNSILDFDPAISSASDYKILSVSFDWAVFDNSGGIDFGLDVYDDGIGNWRNDFFTVDGVANGATGSSGTLTFNSAWEITSLRFHDNGNYDVGMDNLTINDSTAVPEPATLSFFGLGLLGLFGLGKKKK